MLQHDRHIIPTQPHQLQIIINIWMILSKDVYIVDPLVAEV